MSRQEDFREMSKDLHVQFLSNPWTLYERGCEDGYQYAVEKACRWIRLHIGVDMPVRLNPDGEPLAEDFFNKAEARCKAADKVVEQFKQFMED